MMAGEVVKSKRKRPRGRPPCAVYVEFEGRTYDSIATLADEIGVNEYTLRTRHARHGFLTQEIIDAIRSRNTRKVDDTGPLTHVEKLAFTQSWP